MRRHTLTSAAEFLRLLLLLPVLAVSAVLLHRSRRATQPAIAPAWSADDTLWESADDDIELSVVIPFYNPGDALRPNVDRLVGGLREAGIGFEVICVSDGSTDGSEHTLAGVGDEVHVLLSPANRGKGAALHTGFAHARGQYVGMVDADGDIDPLHLIDYLHRARTADAHAVYADKKLTASQSASSPLRKLVSFGFSSIVSVLFALGVRDTQTGCKVFSREALQTVLPRLREERFAFDLEFFVAAKAAGLTRLVAAPVTLGERLAGSSVTARTILRTLTDALTVHGRLHLTPTYRTTQAVTADAPRATVLAYRPASTTRPATTAPVHALAPVQPVLATAPRLALAA